MRNRAAMAVFAVGALLPMAVHADGDDGGTEIVVGVQHGTPPSGLMGHDGNRCAWVPAGAASTTDQGMVDERVVDGVAQHLYIRACPASADLVWVADTSPADLASLVADEARARVPAPSFGSAPAGETAIVNADMWLWTAPDDYVPVSTRVAWVPSPDGPIWAQATATPLRIVFEPGEPGASPIVCAGPGTAWDPSIGDDAASTCMYRYLHSSEIEPSGVFRARWSIVWSLTTSGSAGTAVEQLVTTTSTDVIVNEVQAIVVG